LQWNNSFLDEHKKGIEREMSKPLVVGGKLKLKGSSSSSKPKRDSSELASSVGKRQVEEVVTSEATDATSSGNNDIHLTEAQKRFKKKKQEMDDKQAKKLAKTTFRDRMEEFNIKLSKLTEHNDIPRVSAAGNG